MTLAAVPVATAAVFVAYADTDVFTLGQSLRPQAMVLTKPGRVRQAPVMCW